MPGRAALRAVALAALAVLALAGPAASAHAQVAGSSKTGATTTATTQTDPNAPVPVPRMDQAPPGRRLTGEQVQAIAERNPVYRAELAKHRGAYPNVYTKGPGRWQVRMFSRDKKP